MTRLLELRRHAPAEGDAVTEEGRALAERVGRALETPYHAVFSSPAKRAAETVAWLLRGAGQPLPVTHGVTEGLATKDEDRWRAAAAATAAGHIDEIAEVDGELVQREAPRLADAILQMLAALDDGQRGLAIGHSPLLEAGVRSLSGMGVEPLRSCEGVLLAHDGQRVWVDREYRLDA